jgi:hypothetical protein
VDFYCSLWGLDHFHFLVVCELDLPSLSKSFQTLSLSFEKFQTSLIYMSISLSL